MARAGQLKHLVDVYAPRRVERPGGQKLVQLVRVFKGLRCRVVEARGAEAERHAQQVPVHTHRVEFRSRTVDVRPDFVLVWAEAGGQRMEVLSCAPLTDGNSDFDVAYTKTNQDTTPLVEEPL